MVLRSAGTGRRTRPAGAFACFAAAWACVAALHAGAARAQQEPPPAAEARPAEPSPPIEGFRHARFGMAEQQVRDAVQKDFPEAARRLSRATHPSERTTVLSATVDELLPGAGPARVSYILGHASKRLVQVNVVWASDGRTAERDEAIVAAANALRDHFQARYRAPDEIVANRPVGENAILVFRAARADNRVVLLLLTGVAAAGRAGRNPAPPPLALQLSYIRDHARPDVFRIEQGRF
jgi:hypothetical protein